MYYESFQALLDELSDKDLFFVQVGAMDGVRSDPLHRVLMENAWRGLLIEPIPDMFARLRENYAGRAGLRFEQVAIWNRAADLPMYRIPPEKIGKDGLPAWAGGISTLYKGRNAMRRFRSRAVLVTVRCERLQTVLDRNDVDRVDLFQVDAEGADFIVLDQLDHRRYSPAVICWEFVNMPMRERRILGRRYRGLGFSLFNEGRDTIAWHPKRISELTRTSAS